MRVFPCAWEEAVYVNQRVGVLTTCWYLAAPLTMGLKSLASAHSLSANGTSPLTNPAGRRHSSDSKECQEMLNITK